VSEVRGTVRRRPGPWLITSIAIGVLGLPVGVFCAFFAWEMNFPFFTPLAILVGAGLIAGCLAWPGTVLGVFATGLMFLVLDRTPFPERWDNVESSVVVMVWSAFGAKLLSCAVLWLVRHRKRV